MEVGSNREATVANCKKALNPEINPSSGLYTKPLLL
jgi:hypothetical protein